MGRIRLEDLSDSLKEYLNGLGLTEVQVQELIDNMQEEVIGSKEELATNDKSSIVAAINELFQNANNGKQLIADAIGSPLSSDDTFAAMGNSINNMTIDFRNALALKGVNAPADKFETLINRIDDIVQSGNVLNNQVMVSGEYTLTEKFGGFDSNDVNTLTVSTNLSFEPEYFIIYASGLSHEHSSSGYYWKPNYFTLTTDVPTIHPICAAFDTTAYLGHSFHLLLSYDKNSFTLTAQDGINGTWYGRALYLPAGTVIKWYAIGSSQLPNNGGERTITPSTSDQVLPDGYYSGDITVEGDSDLKPENIVEGVEIFGVTGSANISNLGGARYASDTTPTYDYNRTMYTDISIDFTPKSIVVVGGDWYVVVAPNIIPTTKCIMLYRSNGNMTYNNITYEYEVSGNIYKVPAPGGLGYVTWYAWG